MGLEEIVTKHLYNALKGVKREIIKELMTSLREEKLDLNYLIDLVNCRFGIDIRKATKKREYVLARCIYYHIAKKYSNYTLEEIGLLLGANHSKVLYGLKTYKEEELQLQRITQDITDVLGFTNFEYRCVIG